MRGRDVAFPLILLSVSIESSLGDTAVVWFKEVFLVEHHVLVETVGNNAPC